MSARKIITLISNRSVDGAALGTIGVGMLALGTWVFGQWQFASFGSNHVPMAPSTAALFVLLGCALGANHRWPEGRGVRLFSAAASFACLLTGALVALQAWSYFPLPWDDWLTEPDLRMGAIPLGRMSPLTAACFILCAAILLVQTATFPVPRWLKHGANGAAGFGLTVCLIVVLGYALGTPLFYGGATVPMALLTALTFAALNTGLLLSHGMAARLFDRWSMGPDGRIFGSQQIFAWRLTAIIAGLLVVIILSGFFYLKHQQAVARADIYSDLRTVAELKATQITNWRQERLSDGRFLMRAPYLAEDVAAFLSGHASAATEKNVIRWLNLPKGRRYESAELFDPDGKLRLAVPEPKAVGEATARLTREKIRGLRDAALDSLQREGGTGAIFQNLLVPVFAPGAASGAPIALIALRLDPSKFLYPLIQTWPTPSETAETLLVSREGNEVVFLNELRHQRGTALVLHRPVNDLFLPAAAGLHGIFSVIEGLDYRGELVLATTRVIPDSTWLVVAKIDTREAYAPMRVEIRRTTLAVGFLLLTVVLVGAYLWRQRYAALLVHELVLERRQKALTERLAIVTRHANDIFLLLDETGRITEANERALAAYGYSLDELRNLPPGGLRPAADRTAPDPELTQQLDRLASTEGAVFETVHQRKDGTIFPVEVSGRSVQIDSRKYILGVYRDISERKRAEAAILQLNAELEERVRDRTAELEAANRELEAFSYSVSHDLRAPLRSIDGFSHILQEDYRDQLDADGRDCLNRIGAATQHMGQLIDDLLNLSRVTRAELRRERVDLSALARAVGAELQARFPERTVELAVADNLVVVGDQPLLRVALENLLGNAWKFTAKRDRARIELDAERQNGQTDFLVRDNGAGFDMKFADKMFGAFQRLHSTAEFPGTGIGLATVQRIVRRHGGRIWARGEVNHGATFFFNLGPNTRTAHPFSPPATP